MGLRGLEKLCLTDILAKPKFLTHDLEQFTMAGNRWHVVLTRDR